MGTARARLHGIHARSLALIGARQEVRAALDAAADELQRAGHDPLLDEIGGYLGFDRARCAVGAGASFVALGDGDQAEIEATAALALFGEMPEQSRWVAAELGARVDLAAARTLRGDLAGAEDALGPVFALELERRTEAVTQRLTNLGRLLNVTRYRHAVEANRIAEAIEDFTTRRLAPSVTRAIINPPGSPARHETPHRSAPARPRFRWSFEKYEGSAGLRAPAIKHRVGRRTVACPNYLSPRHTADVALCTCERRQRSIRAGWCSTSCGPRR